MTMNSDQESIPDKVGDALRAQRFQMLEDIARELAGDVVFPTSFDAALRLRKEMQNPDLPTARIAQIVNVEPLVATKLMRMANSVLYSPDGTPARNLQAASGRLGVEMVRTTALAIRARTFAVGSVGKTCAAFSTGAGESIIGGTNEIVARTESPAAPV